jgi:hypothetical protein
MSDQASDGSAARLIGAQDLSQEDPQRNQGRKDSVQPVFAERGQRLGNNLLRKDVGEGQIPVLKKLTPQELDLLSKPSVVRMAHPWASLPVMDVVRNNPSEQVRPFLPIPLLAKGLLRIYVPFVPVTDERNLSSA